MRAENISSTQSSTCIPNMSLFLKNHGTLLEPDKTLPHVFNIGCLGKIITTCRQKSVFILNF